MSAALVGTQTFSQAPATYLQAPGTMTAMQPPGTLTALHPPGTMFVSVPASVALGTQAAPIATSPRSMAVTTQESLKMCAKCGGVITGQYGSAGGQFFHPQCFSCDRCGNLLEGPFSMQAGQKVCANCNPMAICSKCGQLIQGEVLSTSDGLKFHPSCFTCDSCNAPLSGKFHKRDGHRLCDNCVPREAHNLCAKCGQPIVGREVSTGDGLYYHPECLSCDLCGAALAGAFNLRGGMKLCALCTVVEICGKCKKPIAAGGAVTTKDGSKFHPQCLACDSCGVQLSGPFHLHEGARLCDNCVPKQDCKVCQRCGQTISGQYVQIAEGAYLHAECFTCACCSKPLSGVKLFRSATTGLAYCSEECHDRGPSGGSMMVPIATLSPRPMSTVQSVVAPQYSMQIPATHATTILEPVPDAPSPRNSKSKKSTKTVEQKKSKSGLCCS